MTRSKVKIEYITNEMNRKVTFTKRKKGLLKKVDELSTLCGIDACAIIFDQHESEPEVWPTNLAAQRVVAKFQNMSDFQQANKMENLESFTRERIKKAQEKLRKLKQDKREKEMTLRMFKCMAGEGPSVDAMSMSELKEMRSFVEAKMKDIASRIKVLKEDKERQARGMH